LLGDREGQQASLPGDVLALPLGQLGRVDQFRRRVVGGVAALVRGRRRSNLFPGDRLFLVRLRRRYPVVAVLGFRGLVFDTTTTPLDRFGFRRAFGGGGGVWGGGSL
jgi:hypothetical protein